jgi:hypothetical protein
MEVQELMRENTAMKKKARAYAAETGEKYVTAQKHIAAQAPEPTAARFPAIATLPIPAQIPSSIDEAREMYRDFRMPLGIDESGDIVEVDLAKNPHAVVFGGTGRGKTVLALSVIESCRTAGWMIFIGDSPGSSYQALRQQAGICAISLHAAEHVRMVRMVADELRARQSDAISRRKAGERTPFRCPPLLLVLDDFGRMLAAVKDQFGSAFELVSDILLILRIGREFKVHLIVTTQDPSPRSIPSSMLDNFSVRVALGRANDREMVSTIAPSYARHEEAQRIVESIGKHDHGRGIVSLVDDDDNSRIVEFQAFRSYTPGILNYAPGSEVEIALTEYKNQASDKIPSLYPRFWFKIDGPNYGQSLADLYACPMVALDRPDGTPDPDMEQYDPFHSLYLGTPEALPPLMLGFTEKPSSA